MSKIIGAVLKESQSAMLLFSSLYGQTVTSLSILGYAIIHKE